MSMMKSMKELKLKWFSIGFHPQWTGYGCGCGCGSWAGGARLRFIFTWLLILTSVSVLSFVLAVYFCPDAFNLNYLVKERSSPIAVTPAEVSDVVSCQFPKLDPFDPTVMKYIILPTEPLDCPKKYDRPILFATDFDSNLVRFEDPTKYGLDNCCYKPFKPAGGDYDGVRLSSNCYPISANLTQIPFNHEFVKVFCNNRKSEDYSTDMELIDMLSFVHAKPATSLRAEGQDAKTPQKPQLNIALIGMDSMSHMQLIRTMPQTYRYLQKVSAIGMQGYTKVGEGTFPNVVALLMGLSDQEIQVENGCWKPSRGFRNFDNCPFIWNNFSEAGFVTSFAEDEQRSSIFNGYGPSGFLHRPTDYYLRQFMLQLGNQLGHTSTGTHSVNLCTGPRLQFQVLLDYVSKLAVRMTQPSVDRKHFSFMWSTSIAHDSIEKSHYGDQPLLNFLEWFDATPAVKADTVLILHSDHGWPYGDEHVTVQPSIERRMPFLYFLFPEWFMVKYSSAIQNLKTNSDRLTTPFDLHETLLDLVDPEKFISNEALATHRHANMDAGNRARGISLFAPVPTDRTCPDAGIAPEFCVCSFLLMDNIPDPDNNPSVRNALQVIMSSLNGMLTENPRCAQLELVNILKAQQGSVHHTNMNLDAKKVIQLIVTFEVHPSSARFEATVVAKNTTTTTTPAEDFAWEMSGLPSRLNSYGNQSYCVPKFLKKYCFCL